MLATMRQVTLEEAANAIYEANIDKSLSSQECYDIVKGLSSREN